MNFGCYFRYISIFCWGLVFLINQATAQTTISGIINDYTPILAVDSCGFVEVQNSSAFQIGDRILIIQMQGAQLDYSNAAAFGDVIAPNGLGNYEFNYVQSLTGNNIGLTHYLNN